jgi:hypothetical protein
VVGPCNALAREASIALARGSQPGVCPLYIAGKAGLGKTHLARALASEAQRQGLERTVYTSAESFTSEFLSSIRSQKMPGFKRRFREQCDLLVIEDVQFLGGKKATQLELFHIVAHLLDAGSRVVFTADREPRELTDLDPFALGKSQASFGRLTIGPIGRLHFGSQQFLDPVGLIGARVFGDAASTAWATAVATRSGGAPRRPGPGPGPAY